MNRILLPVDFSDHTLNTCRYALEIAKKYGSEITLFHAYFNQIYASIPSLPDAYDINPFNNIEVTAEIEDQAKFHIENLQNELNNILAKENIKNVCIKTYITGGDFVSDLYHYCDEYHPSIIVIGTRGQGNATGVFGEIATDIINNSKWPVMAVPLATNFTGLKNIMFASALEEADDLFVRKLFNRFEAFDASIYFVHIIEDDKFLETQLFFEKLTNNYSKEVKTEKLIFDVIEGNNYHEQIESFIQKFDINIIAFIPHKTSFIQRIFGHKISSNKEVFNTSLPIFTLNF